MSVHDAGCSKAGQPHTGFESCCPGTTPTPAREPVAWKIIDERFTSGGILTQDRAEMKQLAKNPSALIVPLVPLMDPPAAPTAERSEGAGVADIVKLYAMRDNAELDAVLADAVRRGLKSVEVPNGILGTIRYELPPTPEAGTVTDGIRRDPRNGKVAEGTWPIACEQRAFVNGAKWWEWHKSKATMFPSDQRLAADEAVRLYGEPTPEAGTVTEVENIIQRLVLTFGGEGFTNVSEVEAELRRLVRASRDDTEDARRLRVLEDVVRGSAEGGWVEVYLSGLRHGVGAAEAFQLETNPNHLGTVSAPTLRAAIDAFTAALAGRRGA